MLHISYTRLMARQMETYDDATGDCLIEEYDDDMAQLLGREDFLAKKGGEYDIVEFWRACKRSRR